MESLVLPGAHLQRWLYTFAQYSFGIYLMHTLIIRVMLAPLFNGMGLLPAVEIPLVVLTTGLIAVAIIKVIFLLPKSEYVVGV